MRICSKCNIPKNDAEFDFRNDYQNFRLECHDCRSNQKRSYYQNNKDSIWAKNLFRNYNLTKEQFDNRLKEQGYKCACCGTDTPNGHGNWHVDHDHSCCPQKKKSCGKCIRGLICASCNIGMGTFHDDSRYMKKAINYLDNHSMKKIILRATAEWNGSEYIKTSEEVIDYDGDISWSCGATQQQKDIGASQQQFYQTLQGQLSAVFGDSSSVFSDLMATYAPIVAAGPNQTGFSAAEDANLRSQAITGTGTAYEHDSQAVGENIAAQGGGNVPGLVSGTNIGTNLSLAESAANQTSGELSQITEANYAQGRQNWLSATQGLAGAPSVFNPATGVASATNTAGENAANTANQIAQQNNSWINAVAGLGGAIGGAAINAGFSSGGSTPDWLNGGNFQPTDINIAPTGSGGVFGTPPQG